MKSTLMLSGRLAASALAVTVAVAWAWSGVEAQRGAAPGPPLSAQQGTAVDLTGTWVAVVTEDWRWRMVTPPKGELSSVPLNAAGRKVAMAWDLAADDASGNQCKAFGVGGIVRQPGRVRIAWQDPQTLKLEFDAGTQTRLLYFDRAARPNAEKTWQGFSSAEWEGPGAGRGAPPVGDARVLGGGTVAVPGGGGQGLRGGPPPRQQARINTGADVKVVTTNFKAGYLRKNGVPYSEQATITEFIHRLPTHPNGDDWLHVVTLVDDPTYLAQTFYTSTSFRREPDGTRWNATPCRTDPPLPVPPARGRAQGPAR